MARILGDLPQRRLERLADDVDAAGLVVVDALHAVQRLGGVEESGTAAGDDAFLDRGAGGVQRVVHAILALLHLDLGRTADLDHGNAAGELGETLLELLAVIVAGGVLDLRADRLDPALDVVGLAVAVDDGGVVLVDGDALGLAEHRNRDVLELDAEILGDHLAAGQDRNVLEHRLAAIAEARSLDGRDLEAAAQLVHDECGQGLALDVLGDDQERTARLDDRFQDRSIACRFDSFFSWMRM
jgi:hypothetical protein